MVSFLRTNIYASYLLAIARIWLGWTWLQAGWHKISGSFDTRGFMMGAIEQAQGGHSTVPGWWANFLENVAMPNSGLFNFLVSWGEFFVGIGLILGFLTTASIFFGLLMNYAFLLCGSTIPNVMMSIVSFFVIIAGFNAGRIGIDRWFIPLLRDYIFRKKDNSTKLNT